MKLVIPSIMDNKEKYARLLEYYDGKKYDHEETADVLDKIIKTIEGKDNPHQAGCAWAVALLCKYKNITTLQIEEVVDEFFEYCKGFDSYIDSIVMGDKDDAILNYYNGFLHKKKGE